MTESYVNLIPTPQGGPHVNGLRTGLTNSLREFCDFRNLLPRGVAIAPEDVWDGLSFVLSTKLEDPQFSGQTKERLSSRESAAFVAVADLESRYLFNHVKRADRLIAGEERGGIDDGVVARISAFRHPGLCGMQEKRRQERRCQQRMGKHWRFHFRNVDPASNRSR